MSRWRVYKDSEIWSRQWVAAPAHENWWEKPKGRRFPEWGMAVQYANRKARPTTLTIKDPSGAFCALTATVNERNHIRLKAGGDTFTLARHEWKPLARFLLTEARKQEEA
jgi:hypothetical protein